MNNGNKTERLVRKNPCLGIAYNAQTLSKADPYFTVAKRIFAQSEQPVTLLGGGGAGGFAVYTHVFYNDIHAAEILKFLPNDRALIKFHDSDLIPSQMDVDLESLRIIGTGGLVANPNKMCPKCSIPWKETTLVRSTCFDCSNCGAKKEDYVS